MRLHNLLTQPGGESEEGREATFKLRYKGKDKLPRVREVVAVLLPLSEGEMQQAQETAQRAEGRVLAEGLEYVIQLLALSLRDPQDLSQRLCTAPADLQALRDGLVAPQYAELLGEYRALISNEYPEVVDEKDAAELKRQAQDFSEGGQPGPG